MDDENLKIMGSIIIDCTAIGCIAYLMNTAMLMGINGTLYLTAVGGIVGIAVGLTGKQLLEIVKVKLKEI